MYAQRLTIRPMGIAVFLAVCLALPVWVWAAPPSSNPGNPFAKLGAQHRILNEKLDEVLANGDGAPPCGAGTEGQRFVVYASEEEVCDNTTGLRWQQEPGSEIVVGDGASCNEGATCAFWQDAVDYCAALGDGSRLPEVKKLISLVDYGESFPALPHRHPFEEVQSARYWSATSVVQDSTSAWFVNFLEGDVGKNVKVSSNRAWCVR